MSVNNIKKLAMEISHNANKINNICNDKDRASKTEIKKVTKEIDLMTEKLYINVNELGTKSIFENMRLRALEKLIQSYDKKDLYIDDLLKGIRDLLNE